MERIVHVVNGDSTADTLSGVLPMFENMVHPGVYKAVGLPGFATWRAAHRTPQRVGLRHEATRSILRALCDAGAFRPGRTPGAWPNRPVPS